MKYKKHKPTDAEATRIFPTGTEKQNRPNKSFETFVSEMFHILEGAQWIPLNPAEDPERAERLLAARRKKSEDAARNANVDNARGWHTGGWSKEQKIKAIMAGSPGMSREEAAKKASLRIGKQKKVNESHNIETLKGIPTSRLRKLHAKYKAKGTKEASREASVIKRVLASRMNEAVSTNDPNRGKPGRKKPIVPPGLDPYDSVHPFTGKRVKSSGKVQKRLSTLSDAGRNEYYKKFGIRSRAASRGGKTQRLYWGLYEEKEVDDEGGMAMGELKSIIANANYIVSMLKPDSQLEGWVQSKITKSADYISSVKDYLSNTPNSISEEEEKKDRYEGQESTSSMIARLVARRHRKLGMKVPADVERDIDPKYKTDKD